MSEAEITPVAEARRAGLKASLRRRLLANQTLLLALKVWLACSILVDIKFRLQRSRFFLSMALLRFGLRKPSLSKCMYGVASCFWAPMLLSFSPIRSILQARRVFIGRCTIDKRKAHTRGRHVFLFLPFAVGGDASTGHDATALHRRSRAARLGSKRPSRIVCRS